MLQIPFEDWCFPPETRSRYPELLADGGGGFYRFNKETMFLERLNQKKVEHSEFLPVLFIGGALHHAETSYSKSLIFEFR